MARIPGYEPALYPTSETVLMPNGNPGKRRKPKKPKRPNTGTWNQNGMGPPSDPAAIDRAHAQTVEADAANRRAYARLQERAAAPRETRRDRMIRGIQDIMNDPRLAEYNDSYSLALGDARAGVTNALNNALGAIAAREAASMQAVDAMPGTINANYDAAEASGQQGAAALAAAQEASGVKPLMDLKATMAPIQTAQATDRAGRLAGVPLIRTGLQGAFGRERQDVQAEHDSAMTDLARQEAEYKASRESGPNWAQNLAIEDFLASDEKRQDKEDAPFWGNQVSVNRGVDTASRMPKLAQAYASGQGTGRGQMAYNEVMRALRDYAKKPKRLEKELDRIKKKYPKRAKAMSLALAQYYGPTS